MEAKDTFFLDGATKYGKVVECILNQGADLSDLTQIKFEFKSRLIFFYVPSYVSFMLNRSLNSFKIKARLGFYKKI